MKTANFQTRARVVDLLGREQIADAPTAISELLKNAIDALASNAWVNFSASRRWLQIEDDGLGMRTSDLIQRWLVLATESKRLPADPAWMAYASPDQRNRAKQYPPLGQKGIGRLAAAALGRGVLVWSRWGAADDMQRTLLLIHWGLFEHPTLTLDQVRIPYLTLPDRVATSDDAMELMAALREWLDSPELVERWPLRPNPDYVAGTDAPYERGMTARNQELWALRREIIHDLETSFGSALRDGVRFLTEPGTLFVILGPREETEQVFRLQVREADGRRPVPSEGLCSLLGFSDPFGECKPRLHVTLESDGRDLSELTYFWQPADYARAVHEIDLVVDWNGVARGKIRRYNEWFQYEFNPREDLPKYHHNPGQFSVHLGYVPGGREHSSLPPDEFREMNERLAQFGALYVYRDGIRVLPYGRIDSDFLGLEERRSRGAGYYFFSHRRMFGAVYIDTEHNGNLIDKASREGFIKNGAYRGFVHILRNVLLDLSVRYYGTEAARSAPLPPLSIPDPSEAVRREAREAQEQFERALPKWCRLLERTSEDLANEEDAVSEFVSDVESNPSSNVNVVLRCFKRVEMLREQLAGVLDELKTDAPVTVSLHDRLRSDFDAYLSERQQFELDNVARIAALTTRVTEVARRRMPDDEQIAYLREQIEAVQRECRSRLGEAYEQFRGSCTNAADGLAPVWYAEQARTLAEMAASASADLAQPAPEKLSGELVLALEAALARQLRQTREVFVPFWHAATAHVNSLATSSGGQIPIGALARTLEEMQERANTLSELAQLGLIVETMDHDYFVLFQGLADSLTALGAVLDGVPRGAELLKRLRAGFESLEQKSMLMSPLYRQRVGIREEVRGRDIRDFLDGLYSRATLGDLEIDYSELFLSMRLKDVNRPIVLAATANLVQNSLYWTSRTMPPRRVRFTVTPGGFVVSDSGPGIAPRDRERVFEPFFSRRKNGRGLGLYIARTNLDSTGLELFVAADREKGALSGANFVIRRRPTS